MTDYLPIDPEILGTSIKVEHGEEQGVLTAVAYLSPSIESGWNLCPWSTLSCARVCLGHCAGRLKYSTHKRSRLWKTRLLMTNRPRFLSLLERDLRRLQNRADKKGMRAAARLNGSSDVAWESVFPNLFSRFPRIQFYDYTKSIDRCIRSVTDPSWPTNYFLVYSRTGEEKPGTIEFLLSMGINVATVFHGKEFPSSWMNRPVVNGDLHDVRFFDPKGIIVALSAKGIARKVEASTFIVPA